MVKFQDPPATEKRRANHSDIARELKSRPGEWALLFEDGARSLATVINQARTVAYLPAGSFEAVTRSTPGLENQPQHRRDIYARYVGENGEYR